MWLMCEVDFNANHLQALVHRASLAEGEGDDESVELTVRRSHADQRCAPVAGRGRSSHAPAWGSRAMHTCMHEPPNTTTTHTRARAHT